MQRHSESKIELINSSIKLKPLKKENSKENLDNVNLVTNETIENVTKSDLKQLKTNTANNNNNNNNDKFDTNTMLLIVCSLFLITEFPQAILIFVSIFDANFYNSVYKPLGDLMDVLVLINNSINFILYCTMSNEFRQVIYSYFKKN